jgi:zinc protease
MRGTDKLNRQQIQDATDKLKAQVRVSGNATGASASLKTTEANLAETLKLVRELLRSSTFPEAEFAQVKQQELAEVEAGKSEPEALASLAMNRHMNAQYRRGDVRYAATMDEQIEDLNKVTLEEVRGFYKQFYGPGEGEIAIAGQFDPAQVEPLVKQLFADWKSPAHYEHVPDNYTKVAAANEKIETPEKANSLFLADIGFAMNDEAADYPALMIANAIFGGSTNSRLFSRIRVKDGLSYGAGSQLDVQVKDTSASLAAYAISAPQNTPKVETDFEDELQKAITVGFTQDELDKAKKTWLDQQAISRADEAGIGRRLAGLQHWGRTFDWQAQLEAKVSALTLDQINAAFRKYADPKALVIVKGGDFKKSGAYQQ